MTLERKTPMKRGTSQLKRTGIKAVGRRGAAHKKRMTELRPAVFRRDGFRCTILMSDGCRGGAENAHHILPTEKGGPDTMENLRSTCWPCHDWIHNGNPTMARRLGFLLDAAPSG